MCNYKWRQSMLWGNLWVLLLHGYIESSRLICQYGINGWNWSFLDEMKRKQLVWRKGATKQEGTDVYTPVYIRSHRLTRQKLLTQNFSPTFISFMLSLIHFSQPGRKRERECKCVCGNVPSHLFRYFVFLYKYRMEFCYSFHICLSSRWLW